MQFLAFGDHPFLDAGLLVCQPHIVLRQSQLWELAMEQAAPILERAAAPAPQRALAAQIFKMLGLQLRPPPCYLVLFMLFLASLQTICALLLLVFLLELHAYSSDVRDAASQHLRDRRVRQPTISNVLRPRTSISKDGNQLCRRPQLCDVLIIFNGRIY